MFSAARTLKEKSNTANYYKEAEDHMFKPREGDNGGDEVFSMDYTPARRKPPIHNWSSVCNFVPQLILILGKSCLVFNGLILQIYSVVINYT